MDENMDLEMQIADFATPVGSDNDWNNESDTDSEDETIERTLHELVGNDDFYEKVRSRLGHPNERDEMGYTLLHAAAWSREENFKILKFLLEKRAHKNSTTAYGHTPLHFAVACRKRNAVATLLIAGASVDSKDFAGRTPLHFAIGVIWTYPPVPNLNLPCDMWIVERLLNHPDINLDSVDRVRNTPLMWAVKRRNLDAVLALLKKGANPNIQNIYHRTPLHKALSPRSPSIDIVYALLSNGADIYWEDTNEMTPVDILVIKARGGGEETLSFAKQVVRLIALRYHIRKSLRDKLGEIPELSECLEKCCREVALMEREIIYESFTLHDFASDCFHLRVDDPHEEIYKPVINLLLSESYNEYLEFILKRMTTLDLRIMLARTASTSVVDRLFKDSSHLTLFYTIKSLNW